jgi:hypothetical protein
MFCVPNGYFNRVNMNFTVCTCPLLNSTFANILVVLEFVYPNLSKLLEEWIFAISLRLPGPPILVTPEPFVKEAFATTVAPLVRMLVDVSAW